MGQKERERKLQDKAVLGKLKFDLLDVLHHHAFHFGDLSFDLGELADLFGVVNAVLHVLLQLRPGDGFWRAQGGVRRGKRAS